MHDAIDLLEEAIPTTEPREVHDVTQRALASAIKVIARADDSSGIIGDACRRLLALHPRTAAAAQVPVAKLVDWMIKFQFEGDVDFFEIDVVAYAPALGDIGIRRYRERLAEIQEALGERPDPDGLYRSASFGDWFTIEWNEQRLAVLDRDVDAIIRTHLRDGKVAAWYEDTARALEEAGEIELAIDWAKQAMDFDRGHQSLRASRYWCELVETHRPDEALDAHLEVFRRWPSSSSGAQLHRVAGEEWPRFRDEVMESLQSRPDAAVLFALNTLHDPAEAWRLAHSLGLDRADVWELLVKAYGKVDPIATLPIQRELVESYLEVADAKQYRRAARRLASMRGIVAGSGKEGEVDDFIAALRETHRRRPRLQQEFDRAGLP